MVSRADQKWWNDYTAKHTHLIGWHDFNDPPPDLTGFDPETWIAQQQWKFARTMPQNPHWYVMLHFARGSLEDLRRMYYLILDTGEDDTWGKTTYRYLTVGGWDYWPMAKGSPPGAIINRRVHDESRAPYGSHQPDLLSERPY